MVELRALEWVLVPESKDLLRWCLKLEGTDLSAGFLVLHLRQGSQSKSLSHVYLKISFAFPVREEVYQGNKAAYTVVIEAQIEM